MKQVDIIELYASDDQHHCMGALHKYMYIDGKCVLAGDDSRGIDEMLTGAKALLHFQNQRFNLTVHKRANATLFYEWRNDHDKLFDYVVGESEEEETSSYGSF